MLEHQAPFDPPASGPATGGLPIDRPNLRVSSLRGRGLLLLQSASLSVLQDTVGQVLGLTLPAAQEVSISGGRALLWLTPAEWLLELAAEAVDPIGLVLTERLGSSLAAVTDVSDAFASLEIGGTGAGELLMTGCSIDLTPHAFPSGRVVRTAIADVTAILWNFGTPGRFRCLVDRSFAAHLLSWLEGITYTIPA